MPFKLPPARAWADIPAEQVEELIETSRRAGWRAALRDTTRTAPFFASRLNNTGLGNWHLLLLRDPCARALDIGCGFGSLPLGLAEHFTCAIGAEMLPERLRYASLRAEQEPWPNARFVRSSGLQLPFAPHSFDLVTMNGVLEWAGLYSAGAPRRLQQRMLEEARRVATPDGFVAVAIENRFALESLLSLPDTHTSLHFVTAMPRVMADVVSRLRTSEPYRVYLYGRSGYRALLSDAGFRDVAILDLVSSYNDYDVVVRTDDALSYRFLWEHGLVRSFFGAAGRVRKVLARTRPGVLGRLSYAYLVVGGASVTTALDPAHAFWRAAREWGVEPGLARFACRGTRTGTMVIVTHDGQRARGIIEIGRRLGPPTPCPALLPDAVAAQLTPKMRAAGAGTFNGIEARAYERSGDTRVTS
jgi:ubiquinone/menaquinone biosynthesis C-methylase UbiE